MAKAIKITGDRLRKFKQTAEPRQELYDSAEQGLFYIQLARGGAWRLRYTYNGKRYTQKIADGDTKPEEARAIAGQWRAKIDQGINPVDEITQNKNAAKEQQESDKKRRLVNTGTFFAEIYSPHLTKMSHSGNATLNIIKNNFAHLFDRDMDKLTLADLRAWENSRKTNNTRPTMVRALSAFKAMINYAAGQKAKDPNDAPVIAENPIRNFTLSAPTAEERDQAKVSAEELNLKRDLLGEAERQQIQEGLKLFAEEVRQQRRNSREHGKGYLADLDSVAIPHWFIAFAHVARLTGMRPSDIRRLRWSDIRQDFRTRLKIIKFTPNKTAHHENATEVSFPITGELEQVLEQWASQKHNPQTGLIFASERTGGLMDKKAYLRHWRRVKELAGVRPDIDFYCYRHNFISDMVNKGFPLLAIAKLVGHKTTAMIEKNYFKADLDDMAAMAAALGGMNFGTKAIGGGAV